MSFFVTVLGSSGMFGTPERACAGYLLEFGHKKIWLDAGAGSWRNLLRSHDYASIDGVILTHRHPDHTSDIFIADHAFQWGGPEPLPPVPLWAPAETIERLTAFAPDLDASFILTTVAAGDTIDVEGAKVAFTEMAHPPETVGVRAEFDGAVLAYSADSGPEADFHGLASGVDLFLCEANLQDSDDTWEGHLRASQAGEIFASLGSRRMVVTHLPPGRDHAASLEQARGKAPGLDVTLANDGDRLEVGS